MSSNTAERPSITVADFVAGAPAQLQLRVVAGARGAGVRRLDSARIQKLGLALAGFTHYVHAGRVQLIGQSELQFLGQLTPEGRREAVWNLEREKISCILVTKGMPPPAELTEFAEASGFPIVQTTLVSSIAIAVVTEHLQEVLAPRERRHGVLMEIHGLGVLIEGVSGVGKSECALDLINRGHRLVADDVVEVWRTGPDTLRGSAPALLREHMEIRGLGILNVREVFGVTAVSGPIQLGLSIRLERWQDAKEVERLGLDPQTVEVLGVALPRVVIPVSPGRNLSTLVETAVRVHLLRMRGYNAAGELIARHGETVGGEKDETLGGGGDAEHPG
jgi:HPr kinase/phosphorylase